MHTPPSQHSQTLPNILLTRTHILIQDLQLIHNLWLPRTQHLPDLPRHKRLARPGWTIQRYALHMLDARLVDQGRREDACGEFGVKVADVHVFGLEVRIAGGRVGQHESCERLDARSERHTAVVHHERLITA